LYANDVKFLRMELLTERIKPTHALFAFGALTGLFPYGLWVVRANIYDHLCLLDSDWAWTLGPLIDVASFGRGVWQHSLKLTPRLMEKTGWIGMAVLSTILQPFPFSGRSIFDGPYEANRQPQQGKRIFEGHGFGNVVGQGVPWVPDVSLLALKVQLDLGPHCLEHRVSNCA
jgi:hypothetical protein